MYFWRKLQLELLTCLDTQYFFSRRISKNQEPQDTDDFEDFGPTFLLGEKTFKLMKNLQHGKGCRTLLIFFLFKTFGSYALCFGKHPAFGGTNIIFCLFDSRGATAAGFPNYSAALLVKVTSRENTPKPSPRCFWFA